MSTITEAEVAEIEKYQDLLKKQLAVLRAAIVSAKKTFIVSAKKEGFSEPDNAQLLCQQIIKVGKQQHLRFLVTSPDIASKFYFSNYFREVQDESVNPVYQIGYLGELIVFVDPYFPTDMVLLGRGSLDDPENFVIVEPATIKVTDLK